MTVEEEAASTLRRLAVAGSNAAVSSSYARVDADILIPGRGEPVKKGTLVCGLFDSNNDNKKGQDTLRRLDSRRAA